MCNIKTNNHVSKADLENGNAFTVWFAVRANCAVQSFQYPLHNGFYYTSNITESDKRGKMSIISVYLSLLFKSINFHIHSSICMENERKREIKLNRNEIRTKGYRIASSYNGCRMRLLHTQLPFNFGPCDDKMICKMYTSQLTPSLGITILQWLI